MQLIRIKQPTRHIWVKDIFIPPLLFQFQMAKTKQKIKEEAMQVKVIERTQQIQLQEQEIIRRERELEAQVRKPAEAEKYRLEKLAEANRYVLLDNNKMIMNHCVPGRFRHRSGKLSIVRENWRHRSENRPRLRSIG